jgi:hypothetical protein
MEKKPLDIKILYLAFHNSLKKVHGNIPIKRKDIFSKLGRQFLIPKPLRCASLREFENMGLLEPIDRDNVRLKNFDIDIENEPDKLIKMIGLTNF